MGTWEYPVIRKASELLAEVAVIVKEHILVGVTTAELDALAESEIRKRKAKPAFKGYRATATHSPFPSTICASTSRLRIRIASLSPIRFKDLGT